MADKIKKPDEEVIVTPAAEAEPEYTVAELAANSKAVFGAMPECVIAAFRVAGVEKATKTKANDIVTKFMTKEVK